MQPEKNTNRLELPVTLDVMGRAKYLKQFKLSIGYLIVLGIIVVGIIIAILFHTLKMCIISSVLVLISIWLMRIFYFEEKKYKKSYQDMIAHNFQYASENYWGIYEISNGAMPICYLKNGQKALFVAFEKGIKVGNLEDKAYMHWEQITQAYRQMAIKGISCEHIDYMDSIGKDTRLENLMERLGQTTNADLRKLMLRSLDFQKQLLKDSYLTYDVFVFYYKMDDNLFKSDILEILNTILEANYVRYYYLRLDDLRELAKTLYGIHEFSAIQACESVFANSAVHKRIKLIAYVKDGNVVNVAKTREELQKENALAEQRKQTEKEMRRKAAKKPKTAVDIEEDIDW
jgi:hypothetical protein